MKICTFFYFLGIELDLGTHLRDKHGNLFLWDLELFWPSFKVGQNKVENMYFYWLSRNWNFKEDLDTHLRDKHGHLFLSYLELFWSSFKVGQTKVENMHFCILSRKWNFKVDLDTHLRDKHWWNTDPGSPLNSWTCGLWAQIYSPSFSNIIGNSNNTQRY